MGKCHRQFRIIPDLKSVAHILEFIKIAVLSKDFLINSNVTLP